MNVVTGNSKQYIVKFSGITGRLIKQARYYTYGIFKGEPHPFAITKESKFNPLQQLVYVGTMYAMIPLIIFTGLMALYGKSALALNIHMILAVGALMGLIGHLYMTTTGDRPLYLTKAMIDGYHREDKH
jgi:thiosulfate reductase cytochrome b subunit